MQAQTQNNSAIHMNKRLPIVLEQFNTNTKTRLYKSVSAYVHTVHIVEWVRYGIGALPDLCNQMNRSGSYSVGEGVDESKGSERTELQPNE